MPDDIAGIRNYYQKLKGAEDAKNQLIETLIERLDCLNEEYRQEKLDHDRETHYNREIQRREAKLNEDLAALKRQNDRDAFVLVLIDGDGMIFDDKLLQQGEAGGKEAAGLLWSSVRNYVQRNLLDIPSDFKVVTRIYANLKGLADVCLRTGITESSFTLEDFARGLTGSKQLFDFVDVGSGKDRADDKICELFKLYLNNVHCRHILFGCSHDNGYARLLDDVSDSEDLKKITLLEGVPFERELATLKTKFATVKFESLFRTAKINVYQFVQPLQNRPSQAASSPVSVPPMLASQMSSSPPVNGFGTNGVHSLYQSPYGQPGIIRTQSTSTSNSAMVPTAPTPLNPAATSWATKAVSAPPVQMASPPATPQPKLATIPRNRFGQRIDPPSKIDISEMKRIQKIHMCNIHFLLNDCPYGDDCTHEHKYKPTKNELETLRIVARQIPCRFGTGCDDIKCIYGHRCPLSIEGSKNCKYGESCRFDDEMHGIDTKVVRTTKVS